MARVLGRWFDGFWDLDSRVGLQTCDVRDGGVLGTQSLTRTEETFENGNYVRELICLG